MICLNCNGTGQYFDHYLDRYVDCETCDGTGEEPEPDPQPDGHGRSYLSWREDRLRQRRDASREHNPPD